MAGAVSLHLRTLSRKPLGLKVQAWASSTTLKSCSLPICGFHANRVERMFSLFHNGLRSPSYLPASQGGESLHLFSKDVTFPNPSEGLPILTATHWGWTLSPWKFGGPHTSQVAQDWSVCSSLWLSGLVHSYRVFFINNNKKKKKTYYGAFGNGSVGKVLALHVWGATVHSDPQKSHKRWVGINGPTKILACRRWRQSKLTS